MYVKTRYEINTAYQVNAVLNLVEIGNTAHEAIAAVWLLADGMTMDALYIAEEILKQQGIPVDRLSTMEIMTDGRVPAPLRGTE